MTGRVTVRVQQSVRQGHRHLALRALNTNARPQRHMHRDDEQQLIATHERLGVRRLPEYEVDPKRCMGRRRRNRSVLLAGEGREVHRVRIRREQMLLQYDSRFRLHFLRTQ